MGSDTPLRLILNADDFGYDEDTVAATIDAFERGLLSSATIMTNMPASDSAINWAREHPEYSFGVHLVWVSDGIERPLSGPEEISSLVGSEGYFRHSHEMRVRGMIGLVSREEISAEAERQIRRLSDAGVEASHVDAHGHLHKYGAFRSALASTLPKLGVRRVRSAQDLYLRAPRRSPNVWLGPHWRRRLRSLFATTDHFYMPASDGDSDWGSSLEGLLRRLGGVVEVGVHPGRREPWRADELRQLETLRARISDDEIVDWRVV